MADTQSTLPQPIHNAAGSLAPQKPTEFSGFLRLLSITSYEDTPQIENYERQVYDLLKNSPQNIEGLEVLLRIELMLGNHQKAQSIAYRIWEIGGTMKPEFEKSYINDLLNLSLIEMALILLKPYFERMTDNINDYGHLFLKYAIASGQVMVLEKVASQLMTVGSKKALTDFTAVYRYLNYTETFRGIQRRVLDMVKNTLCAYEFNIYTDRGFTDLEILLYVGKEILDCNKLKEKLDIQISAVCAAKGTKKLNNLSFTVLPISAYSSPTI